MGTLIRDYGLEPLIWDGDEDCEHEWGDKQPEHHPGQVEQTKWKNAEAAGKGQTAGSGQFCIHCNAWRGSLGLEPTFELYIKHLCDIFDEVKRVLRKDGTCWVNIGDTYASGNRDAGGVDISRLDSKEAKATRGWHVQPNRMLKDYPAKSLCQIPSRFAIEMTNRGWILRNEIIWYKRNCMPSSASDRFTVDFEKVFFFTKNKKYWFEQQFEQMSDSTKERDKYGFAGAFKGQFTGSPNEKRYQNKGIPIEKPHFFNEQGRNKRCVWDITTKPFKGAHFAVFPEKLVEPMLSAGCPVDGWVLDPFSGAGTVGVVAKAQNKNFIGIELSPEYCEKSSNRIETGVYEMDK